MDTLEVYFVLVLLSAHIYQSRYCSYEVKRVLDYNGRPLQDDRCRDEQVPLSPRFGDRWRKVSYQKTLGLLLLGFHGTKPGDQQQDTCNERIPQVTGVG